MEGMNIQERYDDIVRLSGYSEGTVRQILKATRQSILTSLCNGERATVPGLCTLTPVVRYGIGIGTETYSKVKVKSVASNSLENGIEKQNASTNSNTADIIETREDAEVMKMLNFADNKPSEDARPTERIITKQISALL